jgi:hypothetical protein
MVTRVFEFERMTDGKLYEVITGTGTRRQFDEYRAEGWRPIHWSDTNAPNFLRYRVVTENEGSPDKTEQERAFESII